ncbi:Gfo/Idh/MocA family oxidoreductase [soil metagenome]
MNRRHFLKSAAAAGATLPFATSGLRAASPNGMLQHASIGAAGMAWGDIQSLGRHERFQLVAVADVDTRNFARVKEQFPDVRCYPDWRELLATEGDKIDSVNVTTPDHMHGPVGMAALGMGKHMYGQKPLAQNLAECRALKDRAAANGLVTQMGIQVSSDFSERHGVALVHAGTIGKIKEVHTFSNKTWGDMAPRPDKSDTPPEGFDWDLWLGVAEPRSFIDGYYHPGNWRKRRDFGTGTLGDMGCHMFSGWYRSLALSAPITVRSVGPAPNKSNWAVDEVIEYIFPGTAYTEDKTVRVTWYDGAAAPPAEVDAMVANERPDQGSILIGTDGVLLAPHGSSPKVYRNGEAQRVQMPDLEPRDHYTEFVEACLAGDGTQPSAPFDYSGPLSEAVLLGCLATALPGESLEWDAAALKFTNSEAANALVRRSYRKGWEVEGLG